MVMGTPCRVLAQREAVILWQLKSEKFQTLLCVNGEENIGLPRPPLGATMRHLCGVVPNLED